MESQVVIAQLPDTPVPVLACRENGGPDSRRIRARFANPKLAGQATESQRTRLADTDGNILRPRPSRPEL